MRELTEAEKDADDPYNTGCSEQRREKPMNVLVRVTEELIANDREAWSNAVPRSRTCPVAVAMREVMPGGVKVWATYSGWGLLDESDPRPWPASVREKIAKFISAADRQWWEECEPFEFWLELPMKGEVEHAGRS